MRLVFSQASRQDLAEAVAFISQDNPDAALRQARLVHAAARRLLAFPGLGTPAEQGFRALQVVGTPFRLIYRQEDDAILIVRVWHGARQWPPASS